MAASDLQKRVLTPTIPFGVPLGRPADSTVAAPVKGRPQSGLQELLVTSPDARSITTLSSGQSSASRQPVRRNIKVKRKSLSSPDQLVTATQAADQQPAVDDSDTDSPEQQGHGIGHPHKLSRFFPELTMN
jgi:glutamine amidotransferase